MQALGFRSESAYLQFLARNNVLKQGPATIAVAPKNDCIEKHCER